MSLELGCPIDFENIERYKRKFLKKINLEKYQREIKIFIASGSTIGDISDYLKIFFAANNVKATILVGDFGRYYEELQFQNKALDDFQPDLIYIHNSIKNIKRFPTIYSNEEEITKLVDKEFQFLRSLIEHIIEKYNCKTVINNIELPNAMPAAHWESIEPGGKVRYVNRLNEQICKLRDISADVIVNDLNYFANKIGLDNYHSVRDYANTSYCMSHNSVSRYSYHLYTTLASTLSLSKKIVVTDLDNTLWNGVIGDDGLDKVMPSADYSVSEVFLEYQKYLKDLSELGVLLSVASKNERSVAEVGLSDSRMLVSVDDFVDIQANWNEKSKNIQATLDKVNLLQQSCVFIDDNPVERDEVRSNCSEVVVPEFKNAVYDFVRNLDSLRLFAPAQLTREDRFRSSLYHDNMRRLAVEQQYENHDEYLKSLEMKLKISPINDSNINRCLQLLGKTNQFNFTNKKVSAEHLINMVKSNNYITKCASLSDKFGDNGIITVIIAERVRARYVLWNWVMSCRVFERKIEGPLLQNIFDELAVHQMKDLQVSFTKTGRNKYVERFIANFMNEEAIEKSDEIDFIIENTSLGSLNFDEMEIING